MRKVTLYTLPQAHITDFAWDVKFDTQYNDATLNITSKVQSSGTPASLRFEFQDDRGNPVQLEKDNFEVSTSELNCQLHVKSPKKWDAEHPNLYTLTTSLVSAGKVVSLFSFRRVW